MGAALVRKSWENQNIKKNFKLKKRKLLDMMVLNFLYSNSYHFFNIIIIVIAVVAVVIIIIIIIIIIILLSTYFSFS